MAKHPIRESLGSLPEQHTVLHGLATKQGMVDHVVVSPSGVYAITGNEWPGRVSIAANGRVSCYGIPMTRAKRDAIDQATRLRRQLSASGVDQHVVAVLSLAKAKLKHGRWETRDLIVAEVADLPTLIGRRQRKIDNVLMYRIADELSPLSRY